MDSSSSGATVALFTREAGEGRLVGIVRLGRVPVQPEHVVCAGRRWRVVHVTHLDPLESSKAVVAVVDVEDTQMDPPLDTGLLRQAADQTHGKE